MARPRKPHKQTHGPSETLSRPAVVRAYERECRRLARRLRKMREARGLTQEQAAEAIGLHPKHMPRLENGKHSVSLLTLTAVATAYKVPLVKLFDDSKIEDVAGRVRRTPMTRRSQRKPQT